MLRVKRLFTQRAATRQAGPATDRGVAMSQQVTDLSTTAMDLPRALFTAEEVAKALAVSKTLVRQLTVEGVMPCRRIGRLVRYAPDDIAAFVNGRDERSY